jgi:hypothetical protein
MAPMPGQDLFHLVPAQAKDLADLPTGELAGPVAFHRRLFQQTTTDVVLIRAQQVSELVWNLKRDLHRS